MRLGDDDVKISLGRQTVFLRPTLRAALRLEQKYNGFHNLFNAVAGANLTALSDVIKEGSGQSTALTDYLDSADDGPLPLSINLDLLINPIVAFILSLGGIETAEKVAVGDSIKYCDYHHSLFRIATGWLGWTPEEAWNATPAEIVAARQGRVEMMSAVFGGKRDEAETIDPKSGSARDHLNALGDMTVQSMAEVPPCA